MPQKYFFTTRDDLLEGLQRVEAACRFKYVLHEVYHDPKFAMFKQLADLRELGFSRSWDESDNPRFVVLPEEVNVEYEEVRMEGERLHYFVHVGVNPLGFIFSPGGLVPGKGLVAGHVWQNREMKVSAQAYTEFTKHFFAGFKSFKSYRIGPEAYAMWKSGARLAPRSLNENQKFDLRD